MPLDIKEPTLLLDQDKCRANIKRMVAKAMHNKVRLRPHFKTHQSRQVGEWFREAGVQAITVSSVRMAAYFAQHGWTDITIAFPVNTLQIKEINRLAKEIKLNLLAVSAEEIGLLAEGLVHPVGLFLKIDVGTRRTGIPAADNAQVEQVLAALPAAGLISFKGFLAHAGHTYQARSEAEIASIHGQVVAQLLALKAHFSPRFPDLELSIGDTPSCSVMQDFEGIDEIRPGNFVFYDLMQHQIGAAPLAHIALAMACPIVGKHPDRRQVILYGGAVHFAKDFLLYPDGTKVYGLAVPLEEQGWGEPLADTLLVGVSQEHGILQAPPAVFDSLRIGQVIGVLPVHACHTAHAMRGYLTLSGQWIAHLEGETEPLGKRGKDLE